MSNKSTQAGFTIVELLAVIVVLGIIVVVTSRAFVATYEGYFNLQENSLRTTEVSSAVQRVGRVLRSLTSITKAEDFQLEGFAYFTPRDATLSKVRYFYDSSTKQLKAGVIPASGTPPNYTYNPASEKISIILSNVINDQPIFEYKDLTFATGAFTAANYKDIRAVSISLANAKQQANSSQPIRVESTVTIRPRKSNL